MVCVIVHCYDFEYRGLVWPVEQRRERGEPAMNFVTPSQYSQSNLAHFHINCRAVNDFVKIYPALGREDR